MGANNPKTVDFPSTLFDTLYEKLIYEPIEKIRQILKLIIQILICIVIIIVIPCITVVAVVCYFSFTFMNENFNTYKSLIHILKSVSGNEKSNFMNYGYWSKPNMNLRQANKKLCQIIYNKASLKNAKHVLDVGCGHGEQDFYWINKMSGSIDAFDIDNNSIKNAKKENKYNNITFETGNACSINKESNKYDRVISLESAFHYDSRERFFHEAYRVLNKGGKLVMADILYNDEYVGTLNNLNRDAFSEMFSIPKSNQISITTYKRQLSDIGFCNIEIEDISDKTFKPYYMHFFNNVSCPSNFGLPRWMFNIIRWGSGFYINTLCNGTNGFKYVITTCEKKIKHE
jgi:microcystin synthetase protein McyJ